MLSPRTLRVPRRIPPVVNVVLLIVYPASWFAPLAEAGMVSWWSGDDITIARGVFDLWAVDPALSLLVALFAVVIPYAKTIWLSAIHVGKAGRWALPVLQILGKLSMADVFLIALYIVIVKGVGVGHVESAWGLWLFTLCVFVSMWVTWVTGRQAGGLVKADPPA